MPLTASIAFLLISGLCDPTTDPEAAHRNVHEDQIHLIEAAICKLLAELRTTQVHGVDVTISSEAPGIPDLAEQVDVVGFLSDEQITQLVELVFSMTRAVTAGMPSTELLCLMTTEGKLSIDTAMGLINILTTCHSQLILESKRTDLTEFLAFAASTTTVQQTIAVLESAAANHAPLPPEHNVQGLLRCNFTFLNFTSSGKFH